MGDRFGVRLPLLVVLASVRSISGDKQLTVTYRILEEQRAHTIVGSLPADVPLSAVFAEDELAELRYRLVAVVWNRPPLTPVDEEERSFFILDSDSGLLTTSEEVPFYFTNISNMISVQLHY